MIKIIVVGDWLAEIYEKALYDGFNELGYETYKFSWIQYFKYYQYPGRFKTDNNIVKSVYYRFQNKYVMGPAINKINKDLVKFCYEIKPDLVFIYKGSHIYPKTVMKLKELGAIVFGYNNDDIFSSYYPKYTWRHYINSIRHYDHIFAYRQKNIEEYLKAGVQNTSILRSYYIKKNNFYIDNLEDNKYSCDVLFIGHYEDDGRDEYIKSVIDNGIDLKLYGTGWGRSKYYSFFKERFGEILPVYEDYNLALNSAKIALVFLSKINNDTYTRRCFEITAAKTLMLSEYTDDLNNMFREDKEAVYFRCKEELIEKIRFYLENDIKREMIAEAGYRRLLDSKHDSVARVQEIVEVYKRLSEG
ncbi:MAG: CgeB family protein [Bacillota bacterium]